MKENLIGYLYVISITVLFIICLITSLKKKDVNKNAERALMLLNWVFFSAATIGYLNYTGKVLHVPHLIRTANIFMLLYMPLSFLYIRHFLFPQKWKLTYLIHLIPLFVYLVDYFPFFIRTASEKAIIYQHLSFVQLNTEFNEGFFMPAGWHVIIRYILMVGYWLAQLVMILKVIRLDGSQFQKDNRTRMNWLIWILVSEALIIFPPLSTFFIGMHSLTAVLIQISGLMAACIQVYFLFSHPEILYGIKGVIIEPVNLHIKPEELDDADQSTASLNILIPKSTIQYIPEQTLDSIENILGQYMEEKKPFLKKGFGLSDMANDTQFTLHQLSGYINIRCGMNFYNYVNQFRIDHCKKLLLANAHQNKTLEAIANESGFQSRATFIRSFKKFTGHTPSEYIKELKPIENVA